MVKIKRSIVNFIVHSRPYLLGFVSGMFVSIMIVGLNAMREPRIEYLAPPPFAENSNIHQMLLYGEGSIIDRSDRYYHRGLDWIIVKDFPGNIDSYEKDFKSISDILYGTDAGSIHDVYGQYGNLVSGSIAPGGKMWWE